MPEIGAQRLMIVSDDVAGCSCLEKLLLENHGLPTHQISRYVSLGAGYRCEFEDFQGRGWMFSSCCGRDKRVSPAITGDMLWH